MMLTFVFRTPWMPSSGAQLCFPSRTILAIILKIHIQCLPSARHSNHLTIRSPSKVGVGTLHPLIPSVSLQIGKLLLGIRGVVLQKYFSLADAPKVSYRQEAFLDQPRGEQRPFLALSWLFPTGNKTWKTVSKYLWGCHRQGVTASQPGSIFTS